MNIRILALLYSRCAAAFGTLVLVVLAAAPWVRVPGWAYVYTLPALAVTYAVFRTASEKPPTLEQLHLEVRRREALARDRVLAENSRGGARAMARPETVR